jgi:hypothetical protein
MNINYLRECLEVDFEAGELYWRRRPSAHFAANAQSWNTRFAGKKAGRYRKDGYYEVVINGKLHLAHRVIWALFYDCWPGGVIDHIDRNPSNNVIDNLRDVTQSVNLLNASRSIRNKSGCKGVYQEKRFGRWVVTYRKKHIGTYKNWFDAVCARKSAESCAL